MTATNRPLHVLERHVYRGPSLHGYRPMIRFVLDLGALEHHPTDRLAGFSDRLLDRLPGLVRHGCSYGEPGGFVRRLNEGTWLGHVVEHVALELQNMVGDDVARGKTRGVPGRQGVYDVVYAYEHERVGLLAGWLALRLVNDLLPSHLEGVEGADLLVPPDVDPPGDPAAPFDAESELTAFASLAARFSLGPTTAALVAAAEARDVPWRRLDDGSFVQFGYGARARRVRASVTDATSVLAMENAADKLLTHRLLSDAELPVPPSRAVESAEEAVRAARDIGFPVALKPLQGNHGRGVSPELTEEDSVRWAYERAVEHADTVLVQRFLPGHDHRLLVVDGRFVAAARRVPAHVVGDGLSTIERLVEETNRDPRRGSGHDRVLTRLEFDDTVRRTLAERGLSPESVPARGERVFLRSTANLSTGGSSVDVTDEVHPEVAEMAARAARAIGLDVAGIDVVAADLRRPLKESGGGIVEVNAGPGLRMHVSPAEGRPRDVAGPILDMLFPGGSNGRIPLVAITGTNGKTTTARMVTRMLEADGKRVGLTTSTGIRIGGHEVASGDTTGPWSARLVLNDPTVEAAVLESARGGMLREGLAFDRATVGAVLNVQSDHLGSDGIDTLDDLAYLKSLVAEVVHPDGHAVLNADDPRVRDMREAAGGTVIAFSMNGDANGPGALADHVDEGGIAVVRQPTEEGDLLTIFDGGGRHPVTYAHEIPATLGGHATVNVQNALAAIAIGYGVGLDVGTMAEGLRGFSSSYEDNPGRLNVYDAHPFRVLLDYAHNADGLAAMTGAIRHLQGEGRALGVVTMPGDRRDEDVVEVGRACAGIFDRVIVREDSNLRGREPGEISTLVVQGLREGGMADAAIEAIVRETDALEAAMREARPGDLVMHFAEKIDDAWRCITRFRPADDERDEAAHDLSRTV